MTPLDAVTLMIGGVMLVLPGCSAPPQSAVSRASATALAACRQSADATYTAQHRSSIYATDTYVSSTRDAPFGSYGLPGITSAGLADRNQRDNLVRDCLNVGASQPEVPATKPAPQ